MARRALSHLSFQHGAEEAGAFQHALTVWFHSGENEKGLLHSGDTRGSLSTKQNGLEIPTDFQQCSPTTAQFLPSIEHIGTAAYSQTKMHEIKQHRTVVGRLNKRKNSTFSSTKDTAVRIYLKIIHGCHNTWHANLVDSSCQ